MYVVDAEMWTPPAAVMSRRAPGCTALHADARIVSEAVACRVRLQHLKMAVSLDIIPCQPGYLSLGRTPQSNPLMRRCTKVQGEDGWKAVFGVTGREKSTFTRAHWRKSAQWVSLIRSHAALVAGERELLWELGFLYPAGQGFIQRRRCVQHLRSSSTSELDDLFARLAVRC